ncbi:MAG: DUF7549 family protein [Halohasta sp.]
MVWIQPNAAGPLAVVSAWIAALLPWNVTYSSGGGQWVLFVRFPFVEFQYTSGFGSGIDGPALRTVRGAIAAQSGQGLESATLVWGGGALVVAAAVVLSVVYYTNETQLADLPVDPVRLMGGLLGLAALLFAVATGFVWTGGFGGIPIPVGVPLVGLLAWVLLRAEIPEEATDDPPGDEADPKPNVD